MLKHYNWSQLKSLERARLRKLKRYQTGWIQWKLTIAVLFSLVFVILPVGSKVMHSKTEAAYKRK